MKNTRNLLSLATAAILLTVTGCSPDNNPMAPQQEEIAPPPPVIMTPRSLILRKIIVTRFSENRSNGETWDWDPFTPEQRKPDIRVSLQRDGYLPAYSSNTVWNANYNGTYTFTQPSSEYDGSLPHEIRYSEVYRIHLVDNDFGGDEWMATATVSLSSLYAKDNANSIDKTINGNYSFRIRVVGDWIY